MIFCCCVDDVWSMVLVSDVMEILLGWLVVEFLVGCVNCVKFVYLDE